MAEHVFVLPDLGEGLEEGTVSAWLVAEGDEVRLNEPIAEIETAKAVVEMPSPFAGRIVRLHVAAGTEARVGEPLVTFDVEGDLPDAAVAEPRTDVDSAGSVASPTAATTGPREAVAATPAVRRLAKDLGVDLGAVSGSGPGGRVTREDVEAFARSGVRASAYAQALPSGERVTAWTVGTDAPSREIANGPTRRAIAERLVASAAIPQVTTFRTVDCTALDAFRRELDVSPLAVFITALATVVRDHDRLNSSWTDQAILVHDKVNVGVAVDTDRGLTVPVIVDVGTMGIGEISRAVMRLARAAREGTLRPGDLAEATIAVSNTGSYGSEAGTPLLNPGHAVTLAFGVIEPRALVVDGRVEARLAATISLTFDHRVLDGATVGRALTALVDLLESRERLEGLPR
jgi:pyruvate dehydrogenase E2 component (dihydrolipoamide acetyltransferase)